MVLYVPESVLTDPGKTAALRIFTIIGAVRRPGPMRTKTSSPKVIMPGARAADRRCAPASRRHWSSRHPARWDEARTYIQRGIDLLAPATGRPRFDAATLFDPRFEILGADGFQKDH